jgi:hypothetical protein
MRAIDRCAAVIKNVTSKEGVLPIYDLDQKKVDSLGFDVTKKTHDLALGEISTDCQLRFGP